MRTFGLLPFRGLDRPKSRLGPDVCLDERRSLSLALLNRAVGAMAGAGVDRVAVVTLDEDLAAAGLDPRAELLVQHSTGLNRAIRLGQAWSMQLGADALLILLPDLPLLEPDDVRALLARLPRGSAHAAVIAPDRHGAGTNGLLLCPPGLIPPSFGPGSAERHRRALALADAHVADAQRPGTQLDLDTPEDVHRLADLGHDWHEYLPASVSAVVASRTRCLPH
jgi:2-phospho-L-lactate guanylyltransferase